MFKVYSPSRLGLNRDAEIKRWHIDDSELWLSVRYDHPRAEPVPPSYTTDVLHTALGTMHEHIPVMRPLDHQVIYQSNSVVIAFYDDSLSGQDMTWYVICIGLNALKIYFESIYDYRPAYFWLDKGDLDFSRLAKVEYYDLDDPGLDSLSS